MSLLAFILLGLIGLEGPTGEGQHSTPDEHYQVLASDYEAAHQAFIKANREAKTKEDVDALASLPGVNARNFSSGFMALAARYPGSTAAEDALIWVASHTFQASDSEEAKRRLARDHVRTAKLGPVLGFQGHYGAGIEGSEAFFREVLAKNPHRDLQGLASYWLARHLLSKAEDARSARKAPKSRRYDPQSPFLALNGADWPDRLRRLDPDAIEREAESILERIATLYADVPHNDKQRKAGPLGEVAGFYLHELRDLAVGQPAPEIEGIDLDGRRFRLSDYRGKVAVLDFGSHFY